MNKIVSTVSLLILLASLIGCTSTQETFTLGFVPSERAEELTPKAEALASFLSERMGMEVAVVVPTTYEPLIEGLRFEHIDATFMDSGPGWLAHKNANAEVVLAELKSNQPFYYGEVFVAADSDLESLDDLVGKKIAYTSFTGSSGFVLPMGTMVKRGLLTPQGDDFASLEKALGETFESYTVAGGYEQALSLLVEGKVDAAGGAHDAPEKFLSEEDREKVRTLERIGTVPSHPIMVGSHVSEETKNKFVAAMLELNNENNLELLQNIYGVDGLVATNTQDHLGDFGPAFEALTGIQEKVMTKHLK